MCEQLIFIPVIIDMIYKKFFFWLNQKFPVRIRFKDFFYFVRHTKKITNKFFVFLDNGQEYEIYLSAFNEIGSSDNATEHLITPADLPTSEPLNIRYTIFKDQVLFNLIFNLIF